MAEAGIEPRCSALVVDASPLGQREEKDDHLYNLLYDCHSDGSMEMTAAEALL